MIGLTGIMNALSFDFVFFVFTRYALSLFIGGSIVSGMITLCDFSHELCRKRVLYIAFFC